MNTLDLTPKWEDLLPWMVEVLKNGNEEGRRTIIDELRKALRAADKYNELIKIENLKETS